MSSCSSFSAYWVRNIKAVEVVLWYTRIAKIPKRTQAGKRGACMSLRKEKENKTIIIRYGPPC